MVLRKVFLLVALVMVCPLVANAQDALPNDNGLATYHTPPRYRPSESHPLRVFAYVVHPVGWVMREAVFRPLSYFASSTETTRSVMGYREPYDYRQPECFSPDDSVPDCRSLMPFNYDSLGEPVDEAPIDVAALDMEPVRQVYFPDVNFDFDVRKLNDLGRGRVRQVLQLLEQDQSVKVVLQGHADFIGSEDYNERLGMDRAAAVKQELVSLGVSAERLSTVTFGESQPIFGDETDWARAVNRRVEVHMDAGAPEMDVVEVPEVIE